MGMVDVTDKPIIRRAAEAVGRVLLAPSTIKEIRMGNIKKGDPLPVAEVAGMNAAKQTHLLIPHCHQIPLDMVKVNFEITEDFIEVRCMVRAQARTGVEMEALVGVSIGLNALWDMVKYLEKDEEGQYPETRITDIRVIKKEKGT
ncbi:MAG: cyclic pyranopterin monophosphate synthase MoaC [Deltaproteobacteria bacterium]|nr:cyclic pyranopterin monophosphate synthase MoaC [Deltaproteobacteria bacterium]MBW1914700.1 cyclic pyranopterin monophosphate synthase MoaC [Deltaproteobacteria bacterium]